MGDKDRKRICRHQTKKVAATAGEGYAQGKTESEAATFEAVEAEAAASQSLLNTTARELKAAAAALNQYEDFKSSELCPTYTRHGNKTTTKIK